MNSEDVKTNTATVTAVIETPKSVTTPAQIKSPINFGAQGVKLASLEDAFRLANAIVASGFAPRGMEKPESVLVAIQLGAELGLTPMAALQNTAVINGRPAIYGDAALALVRASGLLESFAEEEVGEAGKDSFGVRVTAVRRDGSKGCETFTIADAKAAKLWGKSGPWTDYPRRMLKFRARGFVLRDVFGDVLKGLRTVEEVRDFPDERNVTPLSEKVGGGLTAALTNGGAA
jgi:hypothetical protein